MTDTQKALLEQIKKAIPKEESCLFSIVSVTGDGWTERHIVPGFVSDEDDVTEQDFFGDILENYPDDDELLVQSSGYSIGGGESGDAADELLELIRQFDEDNFVGLPEVDCLESNHFTVYAENYRD